MPHIIESATTDQTWAIKTPHMAMEECYQACQSATGSAPEEPPETIINLFIILSSLVSNPWMAN
jgi:hypothetical protein